ncbi:MAG: S8 family serine peptidase [Cellvibrionaceae bacterium]
MSPNSFVFVVSRITHYLENIAGFTRGILLLLVFQAGAEAQILNPPPVLDQVEPVTRQVERGVERVTERVEQRVRERAQDALETVDTQSVTENLDPLLALPRQLPILDLNGATAFVDVEVEDGWRAVDRQWLVMLQPGELPSLQQPDIEILDQTDFADLGLSLLRFRVPDQLNSRDALRQVLPAPLVDRLDRNHIYNPQNAAAPDASPETAPRRPVCDRPLKIGMVDTAIQTDHPAFVSSTIIERSFLEEQIEQPHAHGTAVAGLLVAEDGKLPPRLPQATLYNASVFYARTQYAQGATMMHLVRGLNWLVQQDVSVVNLSLAGPDNRILAAVIARLTNQGKVIVAAAGNQGPAAPPLYPAAYDGVIAATAVDGKQRIYRWANRGDHVDFAAHGVSVLTARSGGVFGRESGTSMAAPVVSAFAACELLANGGRVSEAMQALANKAVDLGDAGRDSVFGYGLLQ